MSLYEELKKKVEAIQAQSAPLRQERDQLQSELEPGWAKVRELSKKIVAIEKPLAELQAALNPLAKQEAKRLKREAEQKAREAAQTQETK